MADELFKLGAKDVASMISQQIKDLKKDGSSQAADAGEQIGESFADGLERGFEDAANRITASSVKINRAFKDLAKKNLKAVPTVKNKSGRFKARPSNQYQFDTEEARALWENENYVEQSINSTNDALDAQNTKLEERNRLINEYYEALKKINKLEPKRTSGKISEKDDDKLTDAYNTCQRISNRTDGHEITVEALHKLEDEEKAKASKPKKKRKKRQQDVQLTIDDVNTGDNLVETPIKEAKALTEVDAGARQVTEAKKELISTTKDAKTIANEYTDALRKESDQLEYIVETATEAASTLDRVSISQNVGDEYPNRVVKQRSSKTKSSYKTIRTHYKPSEEYEGAMEPVLVEITEDFDKIRKENKKNADAVERAKKKLEEFVAKFASKTGGTAQFVEGFDELEKFARGEHGFTINESNLDTVYNKMIELQRRYAELEKNFRQGQSSLNPFVNAINRSQNIGDIFGEVETKFNNLIVKSQDLKDNFEALRSRKDYISSFTERMKTDPSSITPQDFEAFSKQVGEFTVIKSRVEALIKRELPASSKSKKHQNQVEAETVRELIELYEKLGEAIQQKDATEATRLRGEIKSKRDGLTEVDYKTDMRFKRAKEKGFGNAAKAQNKDLADQKVLIGKLNTLYQEYGVLLERAASSAGNLKTQLEDEARDKKVEIDNLRKTDGFVVTSAMQSGFDRSLAKGKKIEQDKRYRALAKQMDADEETRLEKIAKLEKEIGTLRAEADNHDSHGVKQAIREEIQLREHLIELYRQGLEISKKDEAYYRRNANEKTKQAKTEAKQKKKEIEGAFANQVKEAQKETIFKRTNASMKSAENTIFDVASNINFDTFSGSFKTLFAEYQNELLRFKDRYAEIQTKVAQTGFIDEDSKDELMYLSKGIDVYTQKISGLMAEYDKLNGDHVEVLKPDFFANTKDLDKYRKQLVDIVMDVTNGKATIKSFDAETKTLTYTVQTGKNEFTDYTIALRNADNALVSIQGETKKAESVFDKLKRKTKEVSTYFASSLSIYAFVNEIKKGIQYVKEIDSALTELKKVTDETDESYERFLNTAAKVGARIGSTVSEFTQATAEFARLGYSMDLAYQMAEAALVYTNVGDGIDATAASESIISTMKGFSLATSDAMGVVDKFNEVGNRFAITSVGIGDALQRSASALYAAGNTIDESIALITAANSVVQDPTTVGTALKTLSLRVRGAKVELEEAGEDIDGMANSTSELQEKLLALTGGQVDIMLDENTFKSTTQILREMADIWDQMSDINQAASLELLGGKRQANVLSAIISDFETVEDVIKASTNSNGSALKENEKYLDSIQGKVDQFTNSVQVMWNNTIDSDFVKDIVSIGTKIINVVDNIGLLNSALLAIGAYKGLGHVFNAFKGAGITVQSLSKSLWNYIKGVQATAAAEASLTQEQVAKKLAQQGVNQANIQTIMTNGAMATSIDGVTRETFEATLAELGYTDAQIKSTSAKVFGKTATEGLTFADRLLRTSLVETLATEVLEEKAANALAFAKWRLALAEEALADGTGTTADVQAAQAAVEAASIPVDISKISTIELLSIAFTKLKATVVSATKAIIAFLFTNPVGWIILAIGAIAAGTAAFHYFHKTTTELREELTELQSALSDVKQEIEDINSELETTQSRMTELLAMESLSFTEKEELENLKKKNDELQREIDLLQLKEKQTKKETADKFVETMESDMNDRVSDYDPAGRKRTFLDRLADALDTEHRSHVAVTETLVPKLIQKYGAYQEEITRLEQDIIDVGGEDTKKGKQLAREKKSLESDISSIETYIGGKISEWNENIGDLDYFTGDNLTDEQKATNAWIDYIKNTEDKWAITSGGTNAQTNAIKRIFNKDEFEDASNQIDSLVEKLERDPGNEGLEGEIRRIIETTPKLKENLQEAGSSVDAAFNYFTMSSSGPIDDKIDELSGASRKFVSLLNGGLFKVDNIDTGLVDLFNEEGKIIQTKLSQIFVGTDEKTRQEITSVLEGAYAAIKDGLDTDEIENLTSKLGFKFSRQIMEVQKAALSTETIKLFPGLDDEISGIIDKFDELVSAVGSVVDAMETLDQARAEEAYSGSVSLETLGKLMESTENYADIIEVDETGAIKLAANAQEILVQQKIDAIKKNAELALADAELALQEAIHAEQTYTQTGPAQDFLRGMTMEVGGAVAFVTSLWNDLTSGNFDGAWDRAKSARESSLSSSKSEYSSKAAEASVAVKDAEKRLANAEKMNKIAQGLTPDNVTERYSSDEASGGASNKDDAEQKKTNDKLDEIINEFDNVIENLDNKQTYVQNEIEIKEATNEAISKSYYDKMISLEQEKQNENLSKRTSILEGIQNGTLTMTKEVAAALWETEHAIQESAISMAEFRQSITELYVDAFDKLVEAFDNSDDFLSDQQNYIDKYQELMELQGGSVTAGGIHKQISLEQEKMKDNVSELNALLKTLASGVSSGYIKEGSEEWVDLQDKIRTAEEAVLDNKIAIEQYRDELKQLSVDAFELVRNAFSNKDQFFTNQQDYIEGYADLLAAQGIDAPTELYEELIAIEQQKRDNNVDNLIDARHGFDDIVNAGYTAADEEWQNAYQTLVECEKAVQDNDIAMAEYAKTIRDLDFDKFDRFISRLDDVNSEIDNLRNLFDDDVAGTNGEWTEDGITSLGLLYQQMELAQQKSKEYAEKIKDLNEAYDQGEMSEQEYYDRLQELKDGQWDAIDAYESAKDAIVDMEEARIDMIEEGINEEIEAYQELIEVKKEELDAERDLYDFNNKIKNQKRELSEIDRKIASLSGSSADADIAELRKLQAERRELQEGLDDTFYQHSKDSQSKALDKELENFQRIREDYIEELRETLEDTATVIAEKMTEVLANAGVVHDGIQETAEEYGTPISNALIAPWVTAKNSATEFKDVANNNISSLIGESGIITVFGSEATKAKITSVFGAGTASSTTFKGAVESNIGAIKNVVVNSTSELASKLAFPWHDTAKEDGPIATFSIDAKTAINDAVGLAQTKANTMKSSLATPWNDGVTSINTWSTRVGEVLQDAQQTAAEAGRKINESLTVTTPDYTGTTPPKDDPPGDVDKNVNNNRCDMSAEAVRNLQNVLNTVYGAYVSVDGSYGPKTKLAVRKVQNKHGIYASGLYDAQTRNAMLNYIKNQWQSKNGGSSAIGQAIQKMVKALPTSYYANGTMGTDKDQWAITDEPRFGDELVLVPGKDGNLSFMRKGTSVVPADITQNLVEWGRLNPNMMDSVNPLHGINLMSNYIAKPEFNLSFEALVKAGSITQETLPEVKRLVAEELDKFTRKLNYAIKRV